MAPVRYALFGALAFAADGSPVAKWARRLSGDACVQACGNLEEFNAAIVSSGLNLYFRDDPEGDEHLADEPYTTTAADEHPATSEEDYAEGHSEWVSGEVDTWSDSDGFGPEALQKMQGLCQHRDQVTCLEENSEVCGPLPEYFQDLKSHMACVCDLCPGIIEAQIGYFTLAQEFDNGEASPPLDQGEAQGTMCKLASCMQCAAEHPAQCAVMDTQGGRRLTSMTGQMQMPDCPQDATCPAPASDISETSCRSSPASLLLVIVSLLVVAK